MADESDIQFRIEVNGLAAAIKAIGKFDPELRKQIIKDMKGVAAPMVATARAAIPDAPPLSNWGNWPSGVGWNARQFRRRTNVAVRTGAVKGANRDTIPLLTLRNTDPAFYWPFEMSGRRNSGSSLQGAAFIRQLNTFGQASRTLWPAAEQHIGTVTGGLEAIIDQVSREIERAY